jgi:hypothetical protein
MPDQAEPTGFFRDGRGKVHPIFTSPGGVREPSADAASWKASLSGPQRQAVKRWSYIAPNQEMKKVARGEKLDPHDDYVSDNGISWGKRVSNFNEAVHKAPIAKGTIRRGLRNLNNSTFDRLMKAEVFEANAPASFAQEGNEASQLPNTAGIHNGITFVAEKHNAGDISSLSDYPWEKEAVVPQGSRYLVTGRTLKSLSGGRRQAEIHIQFEPKVEGKAAAMAAGGSPTSFFKDKEGNTHPIFQSAGGVRHPMEKEAWKQSMTPEEKSAIKMWTSDSDPMRTVASGEQYGDEKLTNDWKQALHQFNQVVDRAPQYPGTIYRGISGISRDAYNSIVNAKTIKAKGPASFSGTKAAGVSYAGHIYKDNPEYNSVMFVAKQHNGGHLRPFQASQKGYYGNENEVVVPQGSTYKVDRIKEEAFEDPATGKENPRSGRRAIVYIHYEPGSTEPDDTAAKMASADTVELDPSGNPVKYDKSEVQFESPARGTDHCIQCQNFMSPDYCLRVNGKVHPDDWCKLFIINKVAMAHPDETVEMAAGSPVRYFTGADNKVHPVFEGSENRQPMEAEAWKNSVSKDQLRAIDHWTGTGYGDIKDTSRGKPGPYPMSLRTLHEFNTAINTAPQVEGKIFRGMYDVSDEKFDQLTKAKSVTSQSPVSFSMSRRFAKDFGGYGGNDFGGEFPDGGPMRRNSVLFAVEKHNAADLSPVRMRQENGVFEMHQGPEEQEAVVPKGSTYRVKSVQTKTASSGGHQALIHLEWTPGAEESKVELAAPPHFFTDSEGKVHPLSGTDSNQRMKQFIERGENLWDRPTRGAAKNRVATDIARRMGEDPEAVEAVTKLRGRSDPDTMYDQANSFIRDWADLYGQNDNPTVVAHHIATSREFGLDSEPYIPSPHKEGILKQANDVLNQRGGSYEKAYRRFLRAEYGNTQDQLKDAGIDHVSVHRSMMWDRDAKIVGRALAPVSKSIPDWVGELPVKPSSESPTIYSTASDMKRAKDVRAPLQPVTSWSTESDAAEPLGQSNHMGDYFKSQLSTNPFVQLHQDVPREKILSTARTGRGSLPEHEITVLGGPTMVKAVRLDHVTTKFAEGRPEGYFKDRNGNTRPIFESAQRHPVSSPHEWLQKMTPEQKLAVRTWSLSTQNKWMRSTARHKPADTLDAPGVYDMIDDFNHAIDTAPEVVSDGPGYESGKYVENKPHEIARGIHDLSDEAFEKIVGAKYLKANGPVSFTRGGFLAVHYFTNNRNSKKNNVTFYAAKHNGADIQSGVASKYRFEGEVVVPSGSTYKVDKVETADIGPLHGKRHANVYISLTNEKSKPEETVELAEQKYFTDEHGDVHPLTSKVHLAMPKDEAAQAVHDYLAKDYPLEDIQWVFKAKWVLKTVPVSKVDSKKTVTGTEAKSLLNYIQRGQDDPVVLIAKRAGRYSIVDGHHRVRGYQILGMQDIVAWVGTVPGFKDPSRDKTVFLAQELEEPEEELPEPYNEPEVIEEAVVDEPEEPEDLEDADIRDQEDERMWLDWADSQPTRTANDFHRILKRILGQK